MIVEISNGDLVVEMGQGDVSVTGFTMNNNQLGIITFCQGDKTEIGNEVPVKDKYLIGAPVTLCFSKVESIDVVINSLKRIKELMNLSDQNSNI